MALLSAMLPIWMTSGERETWDELRGAREFGHCVAEKLVDVHDLQADHPAPDGDRP
jgi:hypothetical protein